MIRDALAPRLRPDERLILPLAVEALHDIHDDTVAGYQEGAERRRIEDVENDVQRSLMHELQDAWEDGDDDVGSGCMDVDARNGIAEIALGLNPRCERFHETWRRDWALARAVYENQLPRATARLIVALELRRERQAEAAAERLTAAAPTRIDDCRDGRTRAGGLARQPRQRERGARRAPAKRAAGRSSDSDDGPAGPSLALAPPPRALLGFALSRCPVCGGVLLWADGRLVCATRSCDRWGQAA